MRPLFILIFSSVGSLGPASANATERVVGRDGGTVQEVVDHA